MDARNVSYCEARQAIKDGDLLLFRAKRRLTSLIIARAGRSIYSHAGMAAWWHGRLMCLETVEGRGGRASLLSNLVEASPGRIDHYVAAADGRRFLRSEAVAAMIAITGRPYGWRSLIRTILSHAPLTRFLIRPDTDDDANGSLPVCSEAVSRAYRAGGVDPVPNLADRRTEPGDLARSPFFRYLCTLDPETESCHALE